MKKIIFIILSVSGILISCNNGNTKNAKPLVVAAVNAKVKYQCPMKCQGDTTYTTEGKCPVCGMDLKKVE